MILKLLVALLIAYGGWRLWHGWGRPLPGTPIRPPADPAIAEARALLGLPADASEADIRAAHRRLVSAVHPDRGGSEELARRINLARDVLLKGRSS